jgi:hypothetical protein
MPTRGAKKAKLDPVSAKVKEVLDALQREDCEVGGPPTWLEGLVAAFPLAMGLEAAKDERHAYQEKLGNMVLEILQVTKAKFEESHKAARDEHAAAEAVKSSKEAAVTEAENSLADQQKAESEAHEAYKSSSAAVTEAQKNLKEATSVVESFDSIQLEKAKDRAEYGSALETEFQSLKAGTVEASTTEKKASFSTVKTVLQKAGVDKALILAAEPALIKATDARGVFDNTVVEQVETALKAQVDSLTEEVNNGDTIKASKVAEKEAAQAALTAAEATKDENLNKASEAEAKTKELKANLKDAKESLKEQEKVVRDVDVKAFYQESHAENFRDAVLAFEFLRDRVSAIPEVEAAKVAAMETDEVNAVVA